MSFHAAINIQNLTAIFLHFITGIDIGNDGNNGNGHVWWYLMEKMYCDENCPTDDELKEMKQKLFRKLENLI